MSIFIYSQDDLIYRNGKCVSTYADFVTANPDFPIIEGEYFDYGEETFTTINAQGHNLPAGGAKYQNLIAAINELP